MKTANQRSTIVDVRTPEEFRDGNVEGSLNIPLQELPQRMEEIKCLDNIVLCCASGGRSARAAMFLKQNGITCSDAGAWVNLL